MEPNSVERPASKLLTKVDKRDKVIRGIELAVLFVSFVFNLVLGILVLTVINQNNDATVTARIQNTQRQNQTQDYIKCVLLIRYDNTQEALSTRDGVEHALDSCASKNRD